MVQIELNTHVTEGRIAAAEQARQGVVPLQAVSCGRNRLAATAAYQEGEQMMEQLLSAYLAGVQKNIADTQANVALLQRQDEAIK
ncbi:YwqI/YxiC family protein [Sporolactobacillus shoreicorticis]|uniref:DUF5344 family protein n=1 Tax=Sporolactobacillus shoreicorticis TaxID=1923877 RepID=A0ABW5S1L2_9BACL|nr:DUF5344 family protein [Sporolactobacillus shoreicorticis]MCO7126473.1 YwqI/YxiC family protein [Sporolactobacillus shoreicorticis]